MTAPPPTGRRRPLQTNRLAVIDIGSNSARVMVFERDSSNHLRLLTGSRAPLRLVRDVDERSYLTETTMARTMEALRDFQAIATSMEASQVVSVATAAMRDANNGAAFVARVRRELGLRIQVIDGRAEARYGFIGAVRGLTVSNGLLFDLGGGSIQLTRFKSRRYRDAASLPLGALRLSERFLESDPPSSKQLRRLRNHVWEALGKARLHRLVAGDRLIGTGGTMRNLAKIDQQTRRHPVGHVHAYELSVDDLSDIVERLARTAEKRRDDIPGLSASRADSIVGGAVAIHTLAEYVRAKNIVVSGHGVREGVALEHFRMPMGSPATVMQAALSSLASRFDGWRADAASRRRSIAAALQRALEPSALKSLALSLDVAACLLDIGRSLDVVDRHEHAADILLITDLIGFSHDELGLASAIVRRAGDRHADVLSLDVVREALESGVLDRAAVILALADEIEARCPPGHRIGITCKVGRTVTLSVSMLRSWLVKDLDKRFERAFGRRLVVTPQFQGN